MLAVLAERVGKSSLFVLSFYQQLLGLKWEDWSQCKTRFAHCNPGIACGSPFCEPILKITTRKLDKERDYIFWAWFRPENGVQMQMQQSIGQTKPNEN